MPSYSRSGLVNLQKARDWNTRKAANPSLGVWAVIVSLALEVDRYVIDDSTTPLKQAEKRAHEHCFIDYRGLSCFEKKTIRGRLWFRAIERGKIPMTAPS